MDEKKIAKQSFIWNLIGNVLYAFTSMVLLLLVNRTLGIKYGDIFSIGFAIAQLMLSVGSFQIRLYQATDIKEKFKFSDYWYFRIITCCIMIIVSLLYTMSREYQTTKLLIVLVFCIYRVGDAFSDVYEGRLQQHNRLDIAGKSLSIKVFFPVVAFTISIVIFKDLLLSSIILTIVEFACIYFYTIRKTKSFIKEPIDEYHLFSKEKLIVMKNIFYISLPLFINSFVMNSIYNTPKIRIDTFIETGLLQGGTQLYYNIIFLPAFVMNLFILIFRGTITNMAHDLFLNRLNSIVKKTVGLIGVILILTTLACIASYMVGIPILSAIYGTGDALNYYKIPLLIIVVGGGINAIATVLDNVITIFRNHHLLTISYVMSWIAMQLCATPLIKAHGIDGASYAFLISMLVLLSSVVCILLYSFISYKRKKDKGCECCAK